MAENKTETKTTDSKDTQTEKRPALARSKVAVRTALRAGAGKADLVNSI